jgi:hypothetical protein
MTFFPVEPTGLSELAVQIFLSLSPPLYAATPGMFA